MVLILKDRWINGYMDRLNNEYVNGYMDRLYLWVDWCLDS